MRVLPLMLPIAYLALVSLGKSGMHFSCYISKKVPKIRSMHHFEFSSADVNGTVKYRRNVEDVWSSTKLLKATTNKEQLIEDGLPPMLPP